MPNQYWPPWPKKSTLSLATTEAELYGSALPVLMRSIPEFDWFLLLGDEVFVYFSCCAVAVKSRRPPGLIEPCPSCGRYFCHSLREWQQDDLDEGSRRG